MYRKIEYFQDVNVLLIKYGLTIYNNFTSRIHRKSQYYTLTGGEIELALFNFDNIDIYIVVLPSH